MKPYSLDLRERVVSAIEKGDSFRVVAITPLIEAVGARVLYLSPYSPDFNPIEHWWSQLKAFLRQFSPTTSKMVDTLIKIAMNLINPNHLRNWFSHCCYCPS